MNWHILLAAAFAALVPLALIVTGVELRKVRLRIVQDLKNSVFSKVDRDLPQLALAQARYDQAKDNGRTLGGRQDQLKQYLGGSFYFAVSFAGFLLLFDPISALLSASGPALGVVPAIFWLPLPRATPLLELEAMRKSAAIAGFAFLGGYVFNLRYLIRQTLNQELSALAFVRAGLRLLQGVVLAEVLYHIGAATAVGATASGTAVGAGAFATALGAAFVLGYYPDVGLGRIARFVSIQVKQIDEDALRHCKSIPLEVIDGIDQEISFRLQESNLYDVQNLAVANPIELYAESPYTLIQAFDWVLQAQLCLVVGINPFFALKRHGIRTIFDLERAILSTGAPPSYVRGVLTVVLSEADDDFKNMVGVPAANGSLATLADEEVVKIARHIVAIVADDLHVHRLRALWTAIKNSTAGSHDDSPVWLFDVGWLPGDQPHSREGCGPDRPRDGGAEGSPEDAAAERPTGPRPDAPTSGRPARARPAHAAQDQPAPAD
ncbi:hypothetical protein [Sphingomonas sp. TDK1]|uniref:hypothetical protein n=1 Tax=Sphingomonas sp. TDK1 TaxID=453247 RepID=UPI0007DA0907|nr:hypothetical protein [Sphingomonas sp. TDK1]OAN57185.1 hypothetical protein A7X12_08140 [Sphingomonas sp. TDK1]